MDTHLKTGAATDQLAPRRDDCTGDRSPEGVDRLSAFGLPAVTAVLVTYALQNRRPWFISSLPFRRVRRGFGSRDFFREYGRSALSRRFGLGRGAPLGAEG